MSKDNAKTEEELLAAGALTIESAIEFSGLSRSELFVLMGNGTLPWFKPGRARLIPKRALVAYLAECYATELRGRPAC